MSETDRSFTLSGYQSLLGHFLQDGFKIRNFLECEASEKHLVLRHDIDMSLDYAERMAKAEHEIGVTSTYFVLLRHGLYNLWSRDNVAALMSIKNMGHTIGLHFDASLYDTTNMENPVATECGILEKIIQDSVDIISFHRPAQELVGYDQTLAGRQHTYMPRYMKEMHYYADSRGEWRYGHPLDAEIDKALQLLTHPIWWVFDAEDSVSKKLDLYIEEDKKKFRSILAENCVAYKN